MPSSPKIPRERIIKTAANLVRFIAAQPKGDFRGGALISRKKPGCGRGGLARLAGGPGIWNGGAYERWVYQLDGGEPCG